jgi:hypothetical protein
MSILFSDEYSGFAKKAQVIYIVAPERGAVACATEEIYKNVQNFYLKNDIKSIEGEINSKNCMLLKKDDELEAYEGICNVADKNSVKLFKSKKVFLQKIYIPCFAVKIKQIAGNEQIDVENKESEKKPQSDVENKKSNENQPQELNKVEEKNTNEQSQEGFIRKDAEPQNNNQQNINLPNK